MQKISQNPKEFHKTKKPTSRDFCKFQNVKNQKSLKMHSLKNKREFDFVFKNSFRFSNSAFNLYFLHFSFLQNSKLAFENKRADLRIFEHILSSNAKVYLGLSVSKKIGHAPARNLLKRRARAIFSKVDFMGFCIIFVPNEKIKDFGFAQLENAFKKALSVAKGRIFGKASILQSNSGKQQSKDL